ncbi:hypothetical protein P7C70_g2684, partial [Phenoliferia sp. Uapishka_3]
MNFSHSHSDSRSQTTELTAPRRYSLPQPHAYSHPDALNPNPANPPSQHHDVLDAHQLSQHSLGRRRNTFEIESLRSGATESERGGPSGAPGHEFWQAEGRRYDFASHSPGLPAVPTSTTPRAPMLVLVPEAELQQGKSEAVVAHVGGVGMEDEDRAAVKGLLGLGGSTPVGGMGPREVSVTGLTTPFVDEPVDDLDADLDRDNSSGSDSEDAEGEDDDEEEYDSAHLTQGDEDYTEDQNRRRSSGVVGSARVHARPIRRGRTGTASTTLSFSHTSESQSLTTPPTRSPSPSFAQEEDSPPPDSPRSRNLKRPLPISSVSARTTALPNKRRYRTSTTSGSGAFRCLHPSTDGGPPCPVSFRRSYDLARHRDSKHGDGEKSSGGWRCRTCGGEFARKDSLQRHASNKGHDAI